MILIKKYIKTYEVDGEEIIETENQLIKDGEVLISQSGPIANSELLGELGIEHEVEYIYENT